jgi:hypothetical protein
MFWADLVVDEGIAKTENQINFENFIEGAVVLGILCDKKTKRSLESNYTNKNEYMILYDGLVEVGIIDSVFAVTTIQTGLYKNTITKNAALLEPLALQKECAKSEKIKGLASKYIIKYSILSVFLKNYSYKTIDQIKLFIISNQPKSTSSKMKKPAIKKNGGKRRKTHRLSKR